MKVEILKKDTVFKGFLTLQRAKLRFEKFNGEMSHVVTRLNVYRGDAVAILVYNSKRKTFVMVRQFRYPIYTVEPENGWTLEVVAGSVEGNAGVVETAVREIEEEVGYQVKARDLEYIGKCYPSPGGTSERIFLYAVDVSDAERVNGGGGLEDEAEDIRVEEMSYEKAFDLIDREELCDSKSLLTLNWFRYRKLPTL